MFLDEVKQCAEILIDRSDVGLLWEAAACDFRNSGDLQFARYLVEENLLEARNSFGETPLIYLQNSRMKSGFIKFLIDSGANVNETADATDEDAVYQDERDWCVYITPLCAAVKARNYECVKVLVDAGACIEMGGGFFCAPPLAFAARNNDCAMIKLLLDLGADVNGHGDDPTTPFHYALLYNSVDAANLLLERGADATLDDLLGFSSEILAAEYCDFEFAEKIKKIADAQRSKKWSKKGARTFSQFIHDYISTKKLKASDIYKRAGIDRKHFSKLQSGKCNPRFDTSVQLAFGFSLTSDEASDFLQSARYSFKGSELDNEIKRLLDKKVDFDTANNEIFQKYGKTLAEMLAAN